MFYCFFTRFTGFYWVLLGFTGVLLDFMGFYCVVLRVSLGFTEFY